MLMGSKVILLFCVGRMLLSDWLKPVKQAHGSETGERNNTSHRQRWSVSLSNLQCLSIFADAIPSYRSRVVRAWCFAQCLMFTRRSAKLHPLQTAACVLKGLLAWLAMFSGASYGNK